MQPNRPPRLSAHRTITRTWAPAGHQQQAAGTLRPRRGALAGLTCAVLVMAPGCGGDSNVTLPTKNSTIPAPPSSPVQASPSATSDADAIKGTYRQYSALLSRADRLPASTRRQQLSAYMVDPQLTRVLQRVEELHANNLTFYGSVVVHITNVRAKGNTATLRDCQDSSNSGLMNATTRKKVNRGVKEDHTEASLVKEGDGKWRVSKVIGLGQGC
ncbi:hypothetical protein [Actinomadura sp. SCN-SB]|uniref:hypothetical protein n=1 Tax=Actinomadura sp. SCN-SB TaxID=3373092 RepID=UPI003750E74D